MLRITISNRCQCFTFKNHRAALYLVAVLAVSACKSGNVSNVVQGGGQGAGGAGNNPSGTGGGGGSIIGPIPWDAGPSPTGKSCGNSVVDTNEGESCDDGNTVNGDGCNAICQIEANYVCPEPGKPCQNQAVCGNGILTSNETCDDGNTANGDGCSADCQTIEPGYQCRVPGKPCTILCGDGVIKGIEACDDGNTVSGDGCSSTCKVEPGFECSGSPSVCKPTVCGDGIVEGSEGRLMPPRRRTRTQDAQMSQTSRFRRIVRICVIRQ